MKLLTQYHILVQFCFQGISAWCSVALILAAVLTWTVLWDVLSSLTTKPSFCTASALPWYSETRLCSLAKGHGSCCPLWLLHATAAASLLECSARTKGEEKAEGVWCQLVPLTGLQGCSTRGGGQRALLESRSAEHTPWADPGGIQLYRERREPEQPFWTVLRRKRKGMESGCSSVCWSVFLFPDFKLMDVAGCICEYIKWLKPETGSRMN